MNEKEVSELRRRFRPEKGNIARIRGCYVNDQREIVSEFTQAPGAMPQQEAEELLTILRKTLSGTIGKNLLDIEFATQQVLEGEEHRLLMTLRNSSLGDDDAVQTFYRHVIESLQMEGNYLILLALDTYDIPDFAKDGKRQDDASEVFSYVLCSVCPVKLTKPVLGFSAFESTFRNIPADWAVSPPELGFLFPCFDDRSANIYDALYYTRDTAEIHPEFVEAVFRHETPMPAAAQKEAFQSMLSEMGTAGCSLEVVSAVHDCLSEMIEEHKANKEEESPAVSKKILQGVLESCGVGREQVAAFEQQYDATFGADAQLSPQNIIDANQFEVRTPDVTIRVKPERSDLIQTRMIEGVKYLLIRAEEGVEVNGIGVTIS